MLNHECSPAPNKITRSYSKTELLRVNYIF